MTYITLLVPRGLDIDASPARALSCSFRRNSTKQMLERFILATEHSARNVRGNVSQGGRKNKVILEIMLLHDRGSMIEAIVALKTKVLFYKSSYLYRILVPYT